MKSILVTEELQNSLKPYNCVPTIYGAPRSKVLSNWIYNLDLKRYNILVKDPIDCLNFVTEHMHYYSDEITHKKPEHWLQNPQQVYDWIFHERKGDCDDSAITLASILHSVGNTNIRLALGYYGNDKYADTSKFRMNHAYCLLEEDGIHYLLDPVGDQQVDKVYDVELYKEYKTMISAAADGRIWIHGPWIEVFS